MAILDCEDRPGGLRLLTLNRPERRNALSFDLVVALHEALRRSLKDRVRALLLTGAGKGFCAGADVQDWADAAAAGQLGARDWVGECQAMVVDLYEFPAPTIALINGAAVGAGLDLALACDFRLAARSAKFVCGYTKMGYVPDCGSSWFLPRLIGIEAAKRFVFTNEIWLADQALARGLIGAVLDDAALSAEGLAFADKLAVGPTVALSEAKTLIDGSAGQRLRQQMALEKAAGLRCEATADAKEALKASAERRDPIFRGI